MEIWSKIMSVTPEEVGAPLAGVVLGEPDSNWLVTNPSSYDTVYTEIENVTDQQLVGA